MKEDIEKIDSTIILVCMTILAAFVGLHSLEVPLGPISAVATSISAVLLTICILLTLYGKYRASLRKELFDSKQEKWFKEFKSNLDRLLEDLVTPQLIKSAKATLSDDENRKRLKQDPDKIKEILDEGWKTWEKDLNYPRDIFVENQKLKIEKMLNESFSGPLNEKHALLKYQIERLAEKRYTLFVLGLVAFLVAIGSKLFL